MIFKFLKKLDQKLTQDEFKEVLMITTQDIMFNNVSFNRLTKEREVIEICKKSLLLVMGDSFEGRW